MFVNYMEAKNIANYTPRFKSGEFKGLPNELDSYGFVPYLSEYDKEPLEPKILIIPEWIAKFLVLKGLAYSDVKHYSIMRKHFSNQDLVELYSSYAIIQNIENTRKGLVYKTKDELRSLLSFSERNLTQDSFRKEWDDFVNPQLCNDQVIQDIYSRLTDSSLTPLTITYGNTFKVIDDGERNIIIILKKGFINTLSEREGRLCFLRKLLQSLYKYSKMADVSAHPVFLEYVRNLY